MKLNRDYKRRDEIIFGSYDKDAYMGGCRYFRYLTLAQLRQLVELRMISLNERHNKGPRVRELLSYAEEFAKRMNVDESLSFGGHVVCPERDDYGMDIDSIELDIDYTDDPQAAMTEVSAFTSRFCKADEFDIDSIEEVSTVHLRAWWD